MSVLEALFLGVLQGITEFLPISSSGHLVIAEQLMELPVESLQVFDIAVHFGTLLAIFVYFRKDFERLILAFFRMFIKKADQKDKKYIFMLVVGTIPAIFAGLLLNEWISATFRSAQTVAIVLLVLATFFILSEQIGKKVNSGKMSWLKALWIGVAQAVALIPGVSRSGSTIATGVMFGMKRDEAARFSFLLGAIAITAATLLSVIKVVGGDFLLPDTSLVITGVVSSFLAGYISVAFLMRFLKSNSLIYFSIYLYLIGVVLLIVI
ncbi:undecaprenyl-diphosphatase UppP [Candidatus Peregrinibacteria bacterium]|nr:undecaprenyl-diphosphatase UppP [Candidatus Peregrinibacteria bacterium]